MSLHAAARKLKSANAAERDAAMSELLRAREAAVGPLVEVLVEPGAAVGRIALLLSALGAREAVPALVALLEEEQLTGASRAYATRALGELVNITDLDDDRLRALLMRLAADPAADVRGFAAAALGAVGGAAEQRQLRTLAATDPVATVKKSALEALVKLKEAGRLNERTPSSSANAASAPPLTEAPPASTHADADEPAEAIEEGGLAVDLEALLNAHAEETGASTVEEEAPAAEPKSLEELVAEANAAGGHLAPWLAQLGAARWTERNAAIEALVQAGKEAVPHLIEALASPSTAVRMGACLALMRIQAPQAAFSLMSCATSPAVGPEEKELQGIALKALSACLTGTEEGLAEPLIPLARDADRWVRAGALLCLGRLADRVGTRLAVLALDDPDTMVRETAAVAVSEGVREDDHDLVVPLLAILGGFPPPPSGIREAILIALSRVRVDDEAVKVRLRRRVRRLVLGATSSMRRSAITLLEGAYADDDPPPVGVLDDVLSRLHDDNPTVRVVAASFVARFLEPGMTGALGPLLDAITRHETTVGLLCLEALRRHDTDHAFRALKELAAHGDDAIAQRAQELLEGFEPGTEVWPLRPEPEARTAGERPSATGDRKAKKEAKEEKDSWWHRDRQADERADDKQRPLSSGPDARTTRADDGAPRPSPAADREDPTRRRRRPAPGAVVVEAKMSDAPAAFVDDPSQRLVDRLRAVRDAGGAGRLSADKAQHLREEILRSFADDAPGTNS